MLGYRLKVVQLAYLECHVFFLGTDYGGSSFLVNLIESNDYIWTSACISLTSISIAIASFASFAIDILSI